LAACVSDITVDAVERFLAGRRKAGLGPATLNRTLNVLSFFFNAAVKRDLVRADPVAFVDRPREPRRRWRILTTARDGAVERALR
jgi:site-specific recombinase XerC